MSLALSGCGPICSAVSKGSEGIRDYDILEGDLSRVEPGDSILVYGPFGITEQAYYIAKGEDASQFAGRLRQAGFQRCELLIEREYDRLDATAGQLRTRSASEIQSDYHLESAPKTILFGTILERGPVTVVPFRAVMPVTYQLEFFDEEDKTSTVVEVAARMRYEEIIPRDHRGDPAAQRPDAEGMIGLPLGRK